MLRPKTTATREVMSLDGVWTLRLLAADDTELTRPRDIAVPASFDDILVDAGVRQHVGRVLYERTFVAPARWSDQSVLLRFDAVTHAARVLLDGVVVAEHEGGFTPFDADITGAVRPGSQHVLRVVVDSRLTATTVPPGEIVRSPAGHDEQRYPFDFYNYGGITRSVSIAVVPRRRIEAIVARTRVDGSTGFVEVEVELEGASAAALHLELVGEGGAVVASGSGARAELAVPEVRLWQPGAPVLYELRVRLVRDDGLLVDEYSIDIGIRTVAVDGSNFLINGAPFHFQGFGKHEDALIRGRGHDDATMVHDFELMRWVGANSFRTAHYPHAEEVLDYADRHGIVVIDEVAAVGLNRAIAGGFVDRDAPATFVAGDETDALQAAHARAIRELIERDRHHPSVVMWCLSNEPASFEPEARTYFEPLVELARELDQRPLCYTNMAFSRPDSDAIVDLFDVIGLNRYYGWYTETGDLASAESRLDDELRRWAALGRPLLMTEYGADAIAGLRSLDLVPWSEDYQRAMLESYHRVFDRTGATVGEHVWAFADFETASINVRRVDGNKKGVFTRDRRPKAAAHLLRERWTASRQESRSTS